MIAYNRNPDFCHYTDHYSREIHYNFRMYAKTIGYKAIYIMSGEIGLYEKYGFEKIGDKETIYGTTDQLFKRSLL